MSGGLRGEFGAAKSDARALFEGVSEEAGRFRPGPGTWSMAECLDHLNVVGRLYLGALDRAIDEGRRRGLTGRPPFRYGLLARWLVRSMDAPPLFHMRSPRSFRPASAAPPVAESLPAFVALQDELIDRVARAEGLDLRRVKVVSPASRRLKMGLGTAFAVTAAHQRRHLWQARQVRDASGFPA